MGGVLPFVGLGASALGAGLKIFGGITGAGSARAAADFQAQVAKNNMQIARSNASIAKQQGEIAATNEGLRGRATAGAISAAQGASGVDMNSGSAVGVRASSAALSQLNAMTIKSDSARRAYGFDLEAQEYHSQMRLAKASRPTFLQTILGIGGSVLGSASSMASQGMALDQAGAFNLGSSTPLADINGPAAGLLQPGMVGTVPGIY